MPDLHTLGYVLAGVLLCMSVSTAVPCDDANNSPVISGCGASGTYNMNPGQCCATIYYGALLVTDADIPCAVLDPSFTGPSSGSCFSSGTTTLSYFVQDSAGNFDYCAWSYNVVDNQDPVITCPSSINTVTDPGQCTSVQTFSFPVSDNCPGVSVTSTHSSGYPFPKGTTVVVATATDASGRITSCSFSVTVTDNQSPTLLCPSPSDYVWSAALTFGQTPSLSTCLSFKAFADNTNPTPGSYSFITISSDTGDLPITCYEQGAVDTLTSAFHFRNPVQVTCDGVVWGVDINCLSNCGPDVLIYAGLPNGCSCNGVGWVVRPQISNQNWGSAGGIHCQSPSQTLTLTFGSRTKLRTNPGQCQTASTRFNVDIIENCGISSFSTVPTSPAVFSKSASPITITANALDTSSHPGSCSAVMTVSDIEKPVPTCPTNSYVFTAQMRVDFTTAKICSDWTAYAAGVDNTPNAYSSITISSSVGIPITCSDQNAVNTLAAAFKTHTNVQVTCGGIPWGVGTNCVLSGASCVTGGQDTVLYAGVNGACTCDSVAWVFRPQIGFQTRWGHGGGGYSCGGTPQTITIIFAKAVKLNTLPGVCYANQVTSVTGSDNCPGSITTINPSSTQFNKGTTTVTMTSTDTSSNTGTCMFDVIVTDNQNPTITCPSNFNINTDPGRCTAVQSFTFPASDNCPGVTTSSVPPTGTAFGKGTTTVVGTATDAVSKTATCSFTVTVSDRENPVAICPSNAVVNTDFGVCTATRTYSIGASDNCPGVTFSPSSPVNSYPFPKGVTNIVVTATDAVTNRGTCSFSVTVNDNQNPTITCPANINVGTQPNSCLQTVSFTVTYADNCGATLVTSHNSGSSFPIGVTTVTATATDATGNFATCSFTITVVDPVPPVINCPAKVTAQTDNGRCDAIVGYVVPASDNCALRSVTYSPASGTRFNLGTTTVTATATDQGGLQSSCTFPVVVIDGEAPRVNCPLDKVLNADAGQCTTVTSYNPTATDNCQLSATPPTLNPPSPSTFSVGTSTVTYIATDTAGLFTVCDFTVTVLDIQPPTITCPSNIVVTSDPDECSKIVTFGQGTVNDNCGISSVTSVPASGFVFPSGVTTVTNTVIDRSGLSASCTFSVTVQDATGRCTCGNGRIDPGEQCEVNHLNGATCASKGYTDGGVLDCVNCHYDFSRCAQCNDGRVDGSEECDGTNLNAQTCQTLGQGFTSGQLQCSNQCRFVTTGCGKCGDGAIQAPEEQCDGSDLNQQTCQTVTGVTGGGTLLCGSNCRFDVSRCIVPTVTKPTGSTTIDHLTLGISVAATGFVNDRKVTVTLTDGTNIKSYPALTLALPAGSISAVFQAPSPLAPSNKWKVSVKGETTLYVASSAVFTVKAY